MHLQRKIVLLAMATTYSFVALAEERSTYGLATDIADHYIKNLFLVKEDRKRSLMRKKRLMKHSQSTWMKRKSERSL